MDSPTIVTNKTSSSLSQILYDNKKRFYQIFSLSEDLLFYEIENKISNNSYIYLIQCWNNVNINDDREIYKYIAKLIYHNLTRCDKEYWYFITALMKFKHHITSLVDIIYSISQDQEFITNLFNYNIHTNKYSAEELLEYYQQLLINDKYILIAYNNSFNYHLNSKKFLEHSFISKLIENIFSSTNDNETCMSVSSEIIYQIMNISLELKDTVINWFSYFINKNSYICKMRFISNISEDEDYEKNMIYADKYDLKVYSCILLTIWQKFVYDDFDISTEYLDLSILLHKKDSRLFSDNVQENKISDFGFKKKTILTKLFHIIHKICDYGYFNLIDRISEYDKMITDYTFLIASSRMIKTFDKLGKMKDVYKSLLDDKLSRLKNLKKECQNILRDHNFNNLLSNFYNDCFKWYNKLYSSGKKEYKTIRQIPTKYIENTFLYYNYLYNDKILQFDTHINTNYIDNLLHFCLNFIKDKNNVSNIYLRCKASTFLSYIFGDKKYIQYANNDKCKSQMLISCIDLFIDVENTNSDNQFYLKLEPRYNMYFLFKGVLEGFSLEPDKDELCLYYRENLNNLSEDSFNKIRRLIVLNLYDLNFMLDEIIVNVNILINSDMYTTESIIRSGNIVKSDMAYCFEQLKFMELCSAHIEKIFISKEIIEQFIPMSLDYMKQLLDIKIGRLNKLKYGFDNIKIIKYFAKTYLNISEHDIVVHNVIQDTRGYYENIFLDISKKLFDSNDINEIENTHLEMFNELLIIQKSKLETEDEKTVIPDELLDPIMCSLIHEPVILPSSKNIMDKSVIVRHLLSDQMDPFNRDPLTIEKLEQYNETEEAQVKLEEFRKKLNEFNKSTESDQN